MKTKFEKLNDGLFDPLKKNELSKIKGGVAQACTTVVVTSRWIGNGTKVDGTESEEDPAA